MTLPDDQNADRRIEEIVEAKLDEIPDACRGHDERQDDVEDDAFHGRG